MVVNFWWWGESTYHEIWGAWPPWPPAYVNVGVKGYELIMW